jgi:hypothetical protein
VACVLDESLAQREKERERERERDSLSRLGVVRRSSSLGKVGRSSRSGGTIVWESRHDRLGANLFGICIAIWPFA